MSLFKLAATVESDTIQLAIVPAPVPHALGERSTGQAVEELSEALVQSAHGVRNLAASFRSDTGLDAVRDELARLVGEALQLGAELEEYQRSHSGDGDGDADQFERHFAKWLKETKESGGGHG